jgi:ferredoxin-NADP reductase
MHIASPWINAELSAIRDLGPDIRLFEIAPEDGIVTYEPGAHINIAVEVNGRQDIRSYSLIGLPDRQGYRIAVKKVSPSRGGSAALHNLLPGAALKITAPRNHFPLQFGAASYLLIAGGIGITPLVGMAQSLVRQGADVRMLYAVRSRNEAAFAGELQALLGDRLQMYVSDEGSRLDLEAALRALPPDTDIYFCGPARMLAGLRTAMAAVGVQPAALRFETFGSGGLQANEEFWVKVPRLGLELAVPEGQSMLDALEAAGIEVMSECRRGECGLCTVDVLSVEGALDHRDVFLSEHQKQQNQRICACVSRAVQGGVIIDTAWRAEQ